MAMLDNLQGYWKMESGALGTDSGPNGYNLTNTNTVTEGTGMFGGCGDFERDNTESLNIADASCPNLEIAGDQTWSAWIKPETIAAHMMVMSKDDTGGPTAQMRLLNSSGTGSIRFALAGLSTSYIDSATIITTGSWWHVCGVFDDGADLLKIFLNGTKVQATRTGSHSDTNADFYISGYQNTASVEEFDGLIDDVAIWDRALSDAEVASIYNSGTGRELSSFSSVLKDIIGVGVIPFAR